jgi:uncharacterized protein YndB with AHSA1/START domain
MNIDVAAQIGAIRREVRDGQREGKPVKSVVAARTYETTIEDLWDAISDPVRLRRWFTGVSGDLREGGRYQLEGNASGTITRCAPPRQLAVTWEYGGAVSWVEVRLEEEAAGGARLVLEHTAEMDPHFGKYGPGAVGVGWDLSLLGLAEHLTQGAAFDHEEGEMWGMSDQGKAFIRQSSDGWCDASIAAGTDAGEARAAAAQTTAFFTGEGSEAGGIESGDVPAGERASD